MMTETRGNDPLTDFCKKKLRDYPVSQQEVHSTKGCCTHSERMKEEIGVVGRQFNKYTNK
jgi:hypothetical protein